MAKRVGLVLGGGGITGTAFHAGVLSTLANEIGWDARTAEIIVGTSAGSITATMLRAGYPPADLPRRAMGEPLSPEAQLLADRAPFPDIEPPKSQDPRKWPASPELLSRYAKEPRSARIGGLAAAALPTGPFSSEFIRETIDALCPLGWPYGGLWVCALRLSDGQRVVFGRDTKDVKIGTAVQASCSIPGYFAPVTIDGAAHVDGAMWSASNADVLVGQELDVAVVMAPMAIHTVARVADIAFRKALHTQVQTEIEALRASGTKVIVFEPTRDDLAIMGINLMDAEREAEVCLQVRQTVSQRLANHPEIAETLT